VRSPNRRHERSQFYKYVTPETGLAIIQTRRRRWSSPILFNDPFDVPRQASFGFTDEELLAGIGTEFIRIVGSDEEPSEPAISELVHRVRRANDAALTAVVASTLGRSDGPFAPILRKGMAEFRKAWEETVPDLRVLCVSEIADSAPMWAHYARDHKGLVLQFGSNDDLDSSLLLAEPVIYRSTPPSLPSLQIWARLMSVTAEIDWQQVFREYYYVKSNEWSYEKEWRVISFSPEAEPSHFTDTEYCPLELEGVFVGAAASPDDVRTLEGLLAEPEFQHVDIWRARHGHAERRILFDRIRPPPSNTR
jgi:hypothetical protein